MSQRGDGESRGRMTPLRFTGAALIVALVAGGVSAVWADGGDTSQIHACVDPAEAPRANVTVVAPNDACPPGTTPLHWPASAAAVLTELGAPDNAALDSKSIAEGALPKGISKKLYKPLGIKIKKQTTVKKAFNSSQGTPLVTGTILGGKLSCPASHPLRVSGGYNVDQLGPGDFGYDLNYNVPLASHGWTTGITGYGALGGIGVPSFQLEISVTCAKVTPTVQN